MEYLVPVIYVVLLFVLVNKIKFFRLAELPVWVVNILLGTKMVAALAYYYVHELMYPIDQSNYFRAGKIIHSSLSESWWYYIRLVFGPSGGFLDPAIFEFAYLSNYWSHTGNYSIVRFHAIARLFSFGYDLVHVVLMGFISFIAGVLFYRTLRELKMFRPIVLALLIFCIPSLAFWTAGIHKDGLVYFGISICLYHAYKMTKHRARWSHVFWLGIGILLVTTVRDYLAILLIPAIVMLIFTLLFPKGVFKKFLIAYALGGMIVLIITEVPNDFDIYKTIAHRQWGFLAEPGGSDFEVKKLYPNPVSIVTYFPTAMFNSIFRPLPWEVSNIVQIISFLEVSLLGLLFILAIIYRRHKVKWHPVLVFLLFYSLSNLLLIGLLLDNSGTLVRYRSIAISFLAIILLYFVDFKALQYQEEVVADD